MTISFPILSSIFLFIIYKIAQNLRCISYDSITSTHFQIHNTVTSFQIIKNRKYGLYNPKTFKSLFSAVAQSEKLPDLIQQTIPNYNQNDGKTDPKFMSSNNARFHTDESKAKIAAANKGKIPWNAGKKHSEETRRKIAERTKQAALKKKMELANSMGLSIAEYELHKKERKKEIRVRKLKNGLTEEGRRLISEAMKKRWEAPGYKSNYTAKMSGNRNHSEETRSKISSSIKLKWQDEEYRSKPRDGPSPEVRARISANLKSKWEDPEFRSKMLNHSFVRTDEWKAQISRSIREKWEDPTYRTAVETGLRATFNSSASLVHRRSSRSSSRKYSDPVEIQMKRELKIAEQRERKKIRKEAYAVAKREALASHRTTSLKDILGNQIWFEEKMKRKAGVGSKLMDDDQLERVLIEEWKKNAKKPTEVKLKTATTDLKKQTKRKSGDESDEDDLDGIKYEEDDEYYVGEDENDEENRRMVIEDNDDDEDEDEDLDYFDDVDDDVIEVYDESGELVGSYTVTEFERMQGKGE